MRRTIFYTQSFLFGQEADTSASSISTSININITGNHVALTGAALWS